MNNKELIITLIGGKYLRFHSSKTNRLRQFKTPQQLVSPDVKHAHNYIKINKNAFFCQVI
jgi:hypothetical protein